jgi:hypothetical protein
VTPPEPSPELAARVARVLNANPVSWEPVRRGYTPAHRWRVRLVNGERAFIKIATDAGTGTWLRAEHHVYSQLRAPFMPALLGWDEEGEYPALLLEDLGDAHWPPPWSDERVRQVVEMLEAVRGTPPPAGLPHLREARAELVNWVAVGADPELFLALGLCSAGWLERALPALVAAEGAFVLEGEELLHGDVRSDNLCFSGDRALLVDWNWAGRGNGLLDVTGWLPSLHAEGGPAPDEVLPGQPEAAAMLSGYWAKRAGQPAPFPGSAVRAVQLMQLRTALLWAARALGLPPPDGLA